VDSPVTPISEAAVDSEPENDVEERGGGERKHSHSTNSKRDKRSQVDLVRATKLNWNDTMQRASKMAQVCKVAGSRAKGKIQGQQWQVNGYQAMAVVIIKL
jgi:hypothetical protein